ncbi:GNAT family N-acetyltransferase [Chitinivorax sp. B]|uniref:GNAT family N-acetyltransferase n=1 Tax=Chitinivorax sp. B TaxID=2502235 RepID=UPI0010F9B1A9|nr:GNAT family N-acetyltransferase [Chitinivorax sp. B]
MTFAIRHYQFEDLLALYRICLLTGDSGQDASHLYHDPELLGHVYAAPYAVFAPELCFVLTLSGKVVGYVLGVADSSHFAAQCEADWFPPLRLRYPMPAEVDQSPDARMIRTLHRGHPVMAGTHGYPAHLHIDLLPMAQGQGWGNRLLQVFLAALRDAGVRGVHLGVNGQNQRALAFYQRTGWHPLATHSWGLVLGMELT